MSEGPSSAPLRRLYELGQSPWLDYIERRLIDSGELERLVEEEGIRGVTSNPAIFESAITSSDAYDSAIRECDATMDAEAIYESLGLADITAAAAHFATHQGRQGSAPDPTRLC